MAKVADVGEGPSMDRADIVNAIKNTGHVADFNGESETAALTRMREIEVKQGVARKDRFGKVTRRIVNQHRTGVISCHTLKEILRRRSEHLCTCSACNDDSSFLIFSSCFPS